MSNAVSAAQQAAQSAASANQHLQTQTQQQQHPPPPRMKPAFATLQASAILSGVESVFGLSPEPPAVTEVPAVDAVGFEQSLEWLPVACGALVAAQPPAVVMHPGGHILGLMQPGAAAESAIDVNDGLGAT